LGSATIAIGAVAAVQLRGQDEGAIAAQKLAKAEADRRYQQLLNAYGSGETLDDLTNAVTDYTNSGTKSRG
jgi:hypothetical protein